MTAISKFYENLALAICKQAADDYVAAYAKWFALSNDESALDEDKEMLYDKVIRIDNEIREGDIWELTSDVSWDYVKRHLEREVENKWHNRKHVKRRFGTLAVS